MTVRRGDIRTKRAFGGGTLYDIGVYCINAARNLFRDEPTQVSAISINSGSSSLAEVDETRSPMAHFTRWANYLALAGLAIPTALSKGKLPMSLQIVVRRFDDALALRIGRAFEKARGDFPVPKI